MNLERRRSWMQVNGPHGNVCTIKLPAELQRDSLYRILSLDGGGAKGFYTLGVLKETEAMMNCPLYKRFDSSLARAQARLSRPSWRLAAGSMRFMNYTKSMCLRSCTRRKKPGDPGTHSDPDVGIQM